MATYSATPDQLGILADHVESVSAEADGRCAHAASICFEAGYWAYGQSVANIGAKVQGWGAAWAGSLRQRAALLGAYHEIGRIGAGAAGGAGPALGAAHHWALRHGDETVSFEDWYKLMLARLEAERAARSGVGEMLASGAALEDVKTYLVGYPDLAEEDAGAIWGWALAAVWLEIGGMEDPSFDVWYDPGFVPEPDALPLLVDIAGYLDGADETVAVSFYAELGADQTARIPSTIAQWTYNRDATAHFDVAQTLLGPFAQSLAAASHGPLTFTGSDVILAGTPVPGSGGVIGRHLYSGVYASELFRFGDFDPQFLGDAVSAAVGQRIGSFGVSYSVAGEDVDWLGTVLQSAVGADPDAALVVIETLLHYDQAWLFGDLHWLATDPDIDGPTTPDLFGALATAALSDAGDEGSTDHLLGQLIVVAGEAGLDPEILIPVVNALPAMGMGFFEALTAAQVFGDGDVEYVVLGEDEMAAFIATVVDDQGATEALLGVIPLAIGELLANADLPAEVENLSAKLGEVMGTLSAAIAVSNIASAQEKDAMIAFWVGMLDWLAVVKPSTFVVGGVQDFLTDQIGDLGASVSKNVANQVYSDFVAYGQTVLGSGFEGQARAESDAMLDALRDQYEEFLVTSILASNGELSSSVQEFLDARYAGDPNYDFLSQAGTIVTDMTDLQSVAYQQWLDWAAVSSEPVQDAIQEFNINFTNELPVFNA